MTQAAKFPETKSELSLSSMLAKARGLDFARPNRFEVQIFRPPGAGTYSTGTPNPAQGSLTKFGTDDMISLSLRCQSITMPFRALTTIEDANIYGPTREIASGISYAGDIDLVFQSNGDLGERVFFEEWQKQAFNETTWNLNYHKEYVGEIQIFLLDMQDVRKYGVVLHEVYPKTINGIDLSAGGEGIIETTVGVSFRWWQALDETRTGFHTRRIEALDQVRRIKDRNLPATKSKLDYGF